jgi:hypothetical protein
VQATPGFFHLHGCCSRHVFLGGPTFISLVGMSSQIFLYNSRQLVLNCVYITLILFLNLIYDRLTYVLLMTSNLYLCYPSSVCLPHHYIQLSGGKCGLRSTSKSPDSSNLLLIIVLFMFIVRISHYVACNESMISEQWIRNDVAGSGRDLLEVLLQLRKNTASYIQCSWYPVQRLNPELTCRSAAQWFIAFCIGCQL